jgi:hypothetical protein
VVAGLAGDDTLGRCAGGRRGAGGRGRPPLAAARRAGLELVEKLLTTNLTSTETTERNDGILRCVRPVASIVDMVELLVVLVLLAT